MHRFTSHSKQTLLVIFVILFLVACGDDDETPQPEPDPKAVASSITVETITPTGNYTGHDGLSLNSNGDLYISDLSSGNGTTIYKVTPTGATTVFASGLGGPMGHTFDDSGNLLVAFRRETEIASIDPQGNRTVFLSDGRFTGGDLVRADDGTLYHSVFGSNSVFKISPTKEVTLIASGGPLNVPFGIAMDDDANIYVANFSDGRVNKITQAGEVSTLATLSAPATIGYLIFANGKLYATGFTAHCIFSIDLDGTITPIAGTGVRANTDGPAQEAEFFSPNGLAASPDGKTIYVSQPNALVRKMNLP